MQNNYFGFTSPFQYDLSKPIYSVCILDQSGSMGIKDYPPSRLRAAITATKAFLEEKIKHRPQDKIGIVCFSATSRCICPFTNATDHQKIFQSLENLHPLSSTDFVKGLATARKMFEEEIGIKQAKPGFLKLLFNPSEAETPKQCATKFIPHAIFLSDGAHTEKSDPIVAAKRLRELGVLLECIGIGGSPQDVNEDCLKAMASTGPDGRPRYRFIGDSRALIQDFRRMATLKIL